MEKWRGRDLVCGVFRDRRGLDRRFCDRREDILSFFDDSVEAGTLEGTGPGRSDEAYINALRHMILLAAKLIADDLADVACQQLDFVYDRCDGESSPPDFVKGQDAPVLNAMILQLMADMGCL